MLAELEDARREIAELRELQGPAADDNGAGSQSDAERLAAAQVRGLLLSGLEERDGGQDAMHATLQCSRHNISLHTRQIKQPW